MFRLSTPDGKAAPEDEPSDHCGATLEYDVGKSPYVFEKDYSLDQKLRSGSYGVVYTTRHQKTHEEYAVKVIDRTKLKEKDDKATFREIGIMKDLVDVKNVVKLIDVYVVPQFFYIVQAYAQGGDVFDRLAKRVSYTEKDSRDLGIILLETMQAMHARKITHRDMKPENLLLSSTTDDTSILIADFGFAKYTPEEGLKTRCGTPAFVAPEILIGQPYDMQVDMWSVGCLLYMLIGGYPPFQDETHRGLFRKIRAADFTFHDVYWKNVSLASKQLITSLLTVDPNDRYNATEALDSPWLEISEKQLSVRDLSGSISELKKFHARQTLKSAVQAVTWSVGNAFRVNKMSELMKETDKAVEDQSIEVTAAGAPMTLNMSLTRKRPFAEIYELRDKIHRGSSAVVKRCYHRDFEKEYAVKIIKRDPKTDEAVLHEVSIMNHLDHPNLVKAVDFFEEENYFYIVMELMAGGDVFDRIIETNNYTEKDARDLAKVLLEAVDYMHRHQVAHRDIKPQNIFLESKNSHSAIKVGDFGFAKRVYTPKSLTSRCGTPSYVAPEILKNQPYDQTCDMWSVGVVLYVTLCGYTPFMEENQEKMFERIQLGDWKFDKKDWAHVSEEAKDLIKHLMNTNVDKRMTAARALKSKWISTMTDKQLSSNDLSQSMRNLKISKPKLMDLAEVFMAFKATTNKAKKGLSTVASSTLASARTSTQAAFKSGTSTMDKSEKTSSPYSSHGS